MTLKINRTAEDDALVAAAAEEMEVALDEWLERVRIDYVTAQGKRVDFGCRNAEHSGHAPTKSRKANRRSQR